MCTFSHVFLHIVVFVYGILVQHFWGSYYQCVWTCTGKIERYFCAQWCNRITNSSWSLQTFAGISNGGFLFEYVHSLIANHYTLNPYIWNINPFWLYFIGKYPHLKVFETGTETRWPLKQTENQSNLAQLFQDDAFSYSYSFWVKSLAIELFKLFESESLAKVAATQTPFAVSMIPLLVKALLLTKNNANHDVLNTGVNLFFSKHFTKLSTVPMEVIG